MEYFFIVDGPRLEETSEFASSLEGSFGPDIPFAITHELEGPHPIRVFPADIDSVGEQNRVEMLLRVEADPPETRGDLLLPVRFTQGLHELLGSMFFSMGTLVEESMRDLGGGSGGTEIV